MFKKIFDTEFLAIFAVLVLAFVIYNVSKSRKAQIQTSPESHENTELKQFTLDELKEYDGKKNKQVYLAVKNIVFDVSASEHYAPGGSYAIFSGHDCSVCLAKMSFETVWLNAYGKKELTQQETQTLDEWFDRMKGKYKKIGEIVETKKDR